MAIITSTMREFRRALTTTVQPTLRIRRISSISIRSNLSGAEKSTRLRASRITGMPMPLSSSIG